MLLFWIIVFIVSLIFLVKGADWLIESAERIGLAVGLSPFIVGVTIVGVGTSLPELISSFVAMLKDVTDVVTANAVGSNVANILLIVGISAVISGKLAVTKNLIDLDLPLLAIGTTLFLGVAWDKQITFGEAILMLIVYGVYLLYTSLERNGEEELEVEKMENEVLPSRRDRRKHIVVQKQEIVRPKINIKDFFLLAVGIISLVFGAEYLIEAVIKLSQILEVGTGVIAITAVAVGTSLPELLVSAKAALQKKSEIALGNIFGSNVFNVLVVVGFPGLFKTLLVDEKTFFIGIPAMAFATFLFIISGISKRIHIWEGLFFISVYILFLAKLFGWF